MVFRGERGSEERAVGDLEVCGGFWVVVDNRGPSRAHPSSTQRVPMNAPAHPCITPFPGLWAVFVHRLLPG
jgi:hypothetical protein